MVLLGVHLPGADPDRLVVRRPGPGRDLHLHGLVLLHLLRSLLLQAVVRVPVQEHADGARATHGAGTPPRSLPLGHDGVPGGHGAQPLFRSPGPCGSDQIPLQEAAWREGNRKTVRMVGHPSGLYVFTNLECCAPVLQFWFDRLVLFGVRGVRHQLGGYVVPGLHRRNYLVRVRSDLEIDQEEQDRCQRSAIQNDQNRRLV
mmetsp:Transcript_24325/g.57253  ORF Transcript_24325/g.57253 Transcript_24325/m.57253 type:complete len:201 (-) Transcript_24325:26-628(-)